MLAPGSGVAGMQGIAAALVQEASMQAAAQGEGACWQWQSRVLYCGTPDHCLRRRATHVCACCGGQRGCQAPISADMRLCPGAAGADQRGAPAQPQLPPAAAQTAVGAIWPDISAARAHANWERARLGGQAPRLWARLHVPAHPWSMGVGPALPFSCGTTCTRTGWHPGAAGAAVPLQPLSRQLAAASAPQLPGLPAHLDSAGHLAGGQRGLQPLHLLQGGRICNGRLHGRALRGCHLRGHLGRRLCSRGARALGEGLCVQQREAGRQGSGSRLPMACWRRGHARGWYSVAGSPCMLDAADSSVPRLLRCRRPWERPPPQPCPRLAQRCWQLPLGAPAAPAHPPAPAVHTWHVCSASAGTPTPSQQPRLWAACAWSLPGWLTSWLLPDAVACYWSCCLAGCRGLARPICCADRGCLLAKRILQGRGSHALLLQRWMRCQLLRCQGGLRTLSLTFRKSSTLSRVQRYRVYCLCASVRGGSVPPGASAARARRAPGRTCSWAACRPRSRSGTGSAALAGWPAGPDPVQQPARTAFAGGQACA